LTSTDRGAGLLLLVATPIGNLDDITTRAVEALRTADRLLAEDTRRTRILLGRCGIARPVERFDAHREATETPRIVERIAEGDTVALVSDAGTPALSDPGARLVRAVRAAGLRVSPLPGPSAVAAAVAAAGVEGPFRFDGFLPRSGPPRREALARIARDPGTAAVLFESPRRIGRALADLAEALGPTRAAVLCRELTKLHEEIAGGTVAELALRFAGDVRGEITLVVLPDPSAVPPSPGARVAATPEAAAALLAAEGLAPSRVARLLEAIHALPHREAYAIAHGRRPDPEAADADTTHAFDPDSEPAPQVDPHEVDP
jgi:16S rRNA (cytidine1402-2'-O)-methyltransferase